ETIIRGPCGAFHNNRYTKYANTGKSGITIRELTIIGLLAGITIALGLSGYGIIPLGPLNVTTLHVPTLIGAIVEGPKVGAFVGFIFGCYSLWQN
ncbi:Membrane protein-like protein, partial [human gut metagenome]